MATLRLRHTLPALRTYEISPAHGGGERHVLGQVARDPRTGTIGIRAVERVLPTTLTLTARNTEGDTSEPLDEAVQRAPAIAAAIRTGAIVVVPVLIPAQPPPAPAPAAEPEEP